MKYPKKFCNTENSFSLFSENDGCAGIPDMLDDDDDNDGRADLTEDRDCDGISRCPKCFWKIHRTYMYSTCTVFAYTRYFVWHYWQTFQWHTWHLAGIPDHLDPDDNNDGYLDRKQVTQTYNSIYSLASILHSLEYLIMSSQRATIFLGVQDTDKDGILNEWVQRNYVLLILQIWSL